MASEYKVHRIPDLLAKLAASEERERKLREALAEAQADRDAAKRAYRTLELRVCSLEEQEIAREAELSRLRADAARQWQPIATAPKDGNTVLLWGPYHAFQYAGNPRCQMGRWDSQSFHSKPRPFWQWGWMGIDWARANPPTHWMPLPDSPVDAAMGAQEGKEKNNG